ncbi:hypothetical protein KKF91_14615 [Myxococcota bacterium]|nr:hypothetical protein [Myxococcota bacterium]MBU1431773.1 hypothetical protein [Myxococcota bacterium]MBU1897468.1 hypothetical protein [Myxococcota bacterium]
MKLSVVNTVSFPRRRVFEAMRDHMPELAALMPNIARIEVLKREEISEGELKLVNLWTAANTEVPKAARAFVDPKKMSWTDHAHWTTEGWICQWRLEMSFMTDRIQCEGTTTYKEKGDSSCEMHISGNLELNLKGLMPGLLIKKVQPTIEGFVVQLIEPNFQKTADALTRYLSTSADA